MANAVYPLTKAKFLQAGLDMSSVDIKCSLVRSYTYSAAHEFLDDVTGGGGGTIVATSANFSTKDFTTGVFDADNITFSSVGAGAACESLVIYNDTGTPATSELVAYIDTASGLPVTPNGADINVTWDSGSSKIFAL